MAKKCPNCLKEEIKLNKRKWFGDYYSCLNCKYEWEVAQNIYIVVQYIKAMWLDQYYKDLQPSESMARFNESFSCIDATYFTIWG